MKWFFSGLINFWGLSGTWFAFCFIIAVTSKVFFGSENISIIAFALIFKGYCFFAIIDSMERKNKKKAK